ncbi:MAG: IS21 family transposase [Myxococcales bacterium FL481]|nr:MAG: IS21 family transposase [Myxococcales bacterium FL481]
MLDLETRTTILKLYREGHGAKTIARALKASRNSVRRVIRSGRAEVPPLERAERLGPYLDRIRELHERCGGNLVRVWEELRAEGVKVGYASVTSFCRRHEIGHTPKKVVGHYHFEPGEEMQHDTSPHKVRIGGARVKVQCASLILCFSRVLYAQVYRRWNRFTCRVFLTRALKYLGGAAGRCMLDNSSVIIVRGNGKNAVPAASMEAFSGRFGFDFVAHELGDANRSAHVERRFNYIERNFYAGRDFTDLDDLNAQLEQWCDRVNGTPRRSLPKTPFELLAVERSALKPLPLHIPEVYELHTRRVDVEGYVNLHTNRYSVPPHLLGRQVEIRETIDRIRVFDGHKLVTEHTRSTPGARLQRVHAEHRQQPRRRHVKQPPSPEEALLRTVDPALATICDHLRKRYGGQALRAIKRMHRIYLDYPTEHVLEAARHAVAYDLHDPGRIEQMVLRALAGTFFRLPTGDAPPLPDPTPDKDEPEDDA